MCGSLCQAQIQSSRNPARSRLNRARNFFSLSASLGGASVFRVSEKRARPASERPLDGCGLGDGDWKIIQSILKAIFQDPYQEGSPQPCFVIYEKSPCRA